MGKSGGRRKKGSGVSNQVSSVDSGNISNPTTLPNANGGVDFDSSIFLKRAHELKEEGNRRFQNKDFAGAFEQYDNALRLTPKTHPDRAVFHSNRAACLMQMKPIDYETVIAECTMALQVQPRFVRALLRRARAFEAIGKYDMAMLDVQLLLGAEPDHRDALEIARRLRTAFGPRQEAQQDLQSRPSPAALGASAVRGAPIAGLGPCLPARPVSKKAATPPGVLAVSVSNKLEKPQVNVAANLFKDSQGGESSSVPLPIRGNVPEVAVRWRPLKLVYDHDIRLGRMPVNCTFKMLREIVSKRFPSSKSVLIKYKDNDGDLVTITCAAELRLAESSAETCCTRSLLIQSASDSEIDKADKEAPKEKTGASEDPESKEAEMDDWLFEFAQLFRTHVGVDPDAHIDLHELGMELCSEALEETVTSEEAQNLFDKAALKFQEVAALAFFNWGNVHMCAARKRIPLDESAGREVVLAQLQVAYDWVKEKYSLAREKYEEALLIKPDFYEGLLALGQQQFEMAKLHWSFALAKKIDLSGWDSTETLKLFDVQRRR
ncbi:hypothetical protein GH714_000321 [Hevea brasiliensis]|uniref:PB1 domain-containing protein n=1 Tax=Hevea brasiliensis TaxID=3981 RepID=A0A6A6MA10_HEVBR|nr:hypothetical protein GH714_000321 [Hevea brasiliensis]